MHASPIAPLGAGENGGLNVYIRAVCEELSRRGVPSEVFTRRSSSEGAERLQLAERSWVTRLAVGPAQELEPRLGPERPPGRTSAKPGECQHGSKADTKAANLAGRKFQTACDHA